MGAHLPISGNNPSNLSAPMTWPETMKLYALLDSLDGKINPYRNKERDFFNGLLAKGKHPTRFQSGPQSAIHRLPFNPSLIPEPVQA